MTDLISRLYRYGKELEVFWRDLGPNAELSGHQRPARKDEK